MVKELQSQLMEVTKRVTLLEGELDRFKSVSPEIAYETTKYPKKPETSRLIEVKADVHHDQGRPNQKKEYFHHCYMLTEDNRGRGKQCYLTAPI